MSQSGRDILLSSSPYLFPFTLCANLNHDDDPKGKVAVDRLTACSQTYLSNGKQFFRGHMLRINNNKYD